MGDAGRPWYGSGLGVKSEGELRFLSLPRRSVMYKINSEQWLLAFYVASLMSLMLLLHPREPDPARANGVAMVTERILNLPDHIVGQPVPMTENLAVGETNYSEA